MSYAHVRKLPLSLLQPCVAQHHHVSQACKYTIPIVTYFTPFCSESCSVTATLTHTLHSTTTTWIIHGKSGQVSVSTIIHTMNLQVCIQLDAHVSYVTCSPECFHPLWSKDMFQLIDANTYQNVVQAVLIHTLSTSCNWNHLLLVGKHARWLQVLVEHHLKSGAIQYIPTFLTPGWSPTKIFMSALLETLWGVYLPKVQNASNLKTYTVECTHIIGLPSFFPAHDLEGCLLSAFDSLDFCLSIQWFKYTISEECTFPRLSCCLCKVSDAF